MLDTMEILAMLNKQAEIGSTYGTVDKRFVMRDVLERVYFVHAIDGLDGEVQWAIEKDITPEKLIAIFMQTATRAEAPVVAAALVRSVTENQDRQRVAEITVDSVSRRCRYHRRALQGRPGYGRKGRQSDLQGRPGYERRGRCRALSGPSWIRT